LLCTLYTPYTTVPYFQPRPSYLVEQSSFGEKGRNPKTSKKEEKTRKMTKKVKKDEKRRKNK